jgi:hypothetical protein
MDVIDRVPKLRSIGAHASKEKFKTNKLNVVTMPMSMGLILPDVINWAMDSRLWTHYSLGHSII